MAAKIADIMHAELDIQLGIAQGIRSGERSIPILSAISRAVDGMSCIRPTAPLGETAWVRKLLSTWIKERTSSKAKLYIPGF